MSNNTHSGLAFHTFSQKRPNPTDTDLGRNHLGDITVIVHGFTTGQSSDQYAFTDVSQNGCQPYPLLAGQIPGKT